MATTKKTKAAKAATRAKQPGRIVDPALAVGAIALLEADHREVEDLFDHYEGASGDTDKAEIAARICLALKVHAQIEEELFYPPAREETGDGDLVDEAIVEHMGAKTLIAQIEAMKPGQPLFDAKVKVLREQIRHHVEEEETELFPEVRETRMDLEALGAKLAARKEELLAQRAAVPAV